MYVRLGSTQQNLAITQATAGTAAGVAAAIPAVASSSLATVGGLALTIPIVGGIIAGVAGLAALFHLGAGCGAACTTAATAEQVYEWAGNMVKKALKAGMLSGAQAYQAGQWLIQQAQANMQGGSQQMANGLNNAIKVINNELPASLMASYPAQTVGLDVTKLQSLFPKSSAGWYDISVTDGNSLALQAIGNLPDVQTSISAAGSAGSTSVPGSTLNLTNLLLIGGGAGLLYALL
jgi:polyhydroxyalkanoate synthesis regulator phasin